MPRVVSMSNRGARSQLSGLLPPASPVHALPLLPCPEEEDPSGGPLWLLAARVSLGDELEGGNSRSFPGSMPGDDPLAPATGVIAGVLLGLAAWALLGVVAASVYLAAHPH